MARLTAEEKATPAVRLLGGRICPRCRYHEAEPPSSSPIVRCPKDGFALIPVERFADADGDPFLGTTVADRFVILGKLGAGSMGTVYRARQEPMGRDVAIKILRSDRAFDAQAKARFTREARAMSLLTSPHTVTVFDFGEIPDRVDELATEGTSLYLAMEMLHGQSLGERLKQVRRLPVEEAVRIAHHALLSLSEAHEKGIIHRDLKPDNLFLTRGLGQTVGLLDSAAQPGVAPLSTRGADTREICKVLDFGIAKVASEQGNVDALETQAGTVFGTPRYMSPEQAQGKPLDARSDLYSLGVLLYQMLVGRPPFIDDDAVVVMARHIKSIPIAPTVAAPDAGIGAELAAVVMRALAKEPADRPASARELIDELDDALVRRRRAPSSDPSAEGHGANATGEMPALVRNSLDEVPAQRSHLVRRRSRAGWILGGTAGAMLLGWLLAFGAIRSAARPALAQRELAGQVRRRLQVALDAVASAGVSAAPPPGPAKPAGSTEASTASAESSAPPASASAAAPPPSAKKLVGPKPLYKRFD